MSNEELEGLLKLLNEISKCGGNSCSDSDKYNIFEVLGVEYKEVIMCRFIGNLLEPKGKHGLGTEPLRLFIRNVLHDEDFGGNLEEAIITLEDSTDKVRRFQILRTEIKQMIAVIGYSQRLRMAVHTFQLGHAL